MEKTCTILTYHLNPDGLGDRFGMVVVVAAALHLCSVILSAQLLQFHRVPAHTQCIKQINCCRIRPFCCVLLLLFQLHRVTAHAQEHLLMIPLISVFAWKQCTVVFSGIMQLIMGDPTTNYPFYLNFPRVILSHPESIIHHLFTCWRHSSGDLLLYTLTFQERSSPI